jgi:hypothetical protein
VQTLELLAAPGAATVAPTLLIRHDGGRRGRLRINAAGERLLDQPLSGRAGRLTLPPLPAGRQRWEVEAPPGTTLHMSHLAGDGESYREHSVQAFGSQRFSYRLQRAAKTRELLTLRLFAGAPGRVTLRVSLSPWRRSAALQRDWTLRTVDYELALEETAGVLPVTAGAQPLAFEALAFHTLGADVPAGELALSVELLGTAGALAGGEAPALFLGVTRASTELARDPVLRVRRFQVSES